MMKLTPKFTRTFKAVAMSSAAAFALSGCGFSPYALPLPGGADTGDDPYTIKVAFRDVLDLVPQSAVRVNDVAVGKVKKVKLNGWTAVVELEMNRDAKLPDNAEASIRQTSLLGEKFVSLAAPEAGGTGTLDDGDVIPLERSGRNPEIEEVLGAASLLFNGGGLEKTQTIVQELNKTLDGNEPEIKELLKNADTFVGQLDDNKEALLTSLEKVNNLAVETNKQKGAITGALDSMPEALRTLDAQRDDLVKLLESLDRLGDVGTRVVKESKGDVVANIEALQPILQNLVKSGDHLSQSVTTLLTFPFTDGSVGGPSVRGAEDFHQGDYFNLQVDLDISAEQLNAVLGVDLTKLIPGSGEQAAPEESGGDPAAELAELVGGLVPDQVGGLPSLDGLLPGAKKTTPAPAQPGATPTPTPGGGLQLPSFCSLLGQCRTAPANLDRVAESDLGLLLLEPVVAS